MANGRTVAQRLRWEAKAVRREFKRQMSGFPHEAKRQTKGFGAELMVQLFGGSRHHRKRR
jgi:hypothetical protein